MITPHDIPGIDHDLFRRGGGVGLYGCKALGEIAAHGPATCPALATTLRLDPDALRRSLNALAEAGIATRDAEGTWSITSTNWDHAAKVLGTAGKAERQRRRHGREQQDRAAAVDKWKQDRRSRETPGRPAAPTSPAETGSDQ